MKRLTLQELASKTSVTKGLISQIENGRSIPSLPVLFSIIHSLEMEVGDFFEGLKFTEPLLIIRRKEEYEPHEKENLQGFKYQNILTKEISASSVNIALLELLPASDLEEEVTDAFKYQYMLSGAMECTIRGETYTLKEGDSLFFNARVAHVFKNNTPQSCHLLSVSFFNQK